MISYEDEYFFFPFLKGHVDICLVFHKKTKIRNIIININFIEMLNFRIYINKVNKNLKRRKRGKKSLKKKKSKIRFITRVRGVAISIFGRASGCVGVGRR